MDVLGGPGHLKGTDGEASGGCVEAAKALSERRIYPFRRTLPPVGRPQRAPHKTPDSPQQPCQQPETRLLGDPEPLGRSVRNPELGRSADTRG